MKTTLIAFFLGFFVAQAGTTFSQENKFTFTSKSSTINDVCRQIEKESDYCFLFSEEAKIIADKKVSVSAASNTIEEVLGELFSGTSLLYRILDDQIVVYKSKEDPLEVIVPTVPINIIEQPVKKQISGKIVDVNGEAIIGANIVEMGTTNGTISKIDGTFSFSITPGAKIQISYIGFVDQVIETGEKSTFDIILTEDSQKLQEIVVTALGIERDKKTLAYSSQQVNMENISKIKDINLGNALAGKIAGVSVTSSSGAAGVTGAPRLIIRGNRSIFGNNQPLIVVDGNPVGASGGSLTGINPDDVVSMNVLKGPTAAALYGSSAQNGAIIITTKKGQIGAPRIEVNSSTTFDMPYIYPEFQNEYGQGSDGAYSSGIENLSWGPKMDGQNIENWTGDNIPFSPQPNNIKDIYNVGYNLINNISYSAGSEKYTVYFSYSNTTAQGILNTNKIQRHNFNVRLNTELFKNFSLDFKLGLGASDLKNKPDVGDNTYNPMLQAIYMPRNMRTQDIQDGFYIDDKGSRKQLTWAAPNSLFGINPYWVKTARENPEKSNGANILGVIKYRLNNYFIIQGRLGVSVGNGNAETKEYWGTQYVNLGKGNYVKESSSSQSFNSDVLLTFNKNITPYFKVNANVGTEIRDNQYTWIRTNVNGGLKLENKFALSNSVGGVSAAENFSRTQKQSVYGMAQLAFHDYLFLDATFRKDWSSTLPKPHKYSYPSIGLTTVLSDMIPLPEFFSFAKLRGIYAEVGNDAPRNMIYQTFYLEPYGPVGWVGPKDNKMPTELIPERTKSWEVGAEFNFLENRLGMDVTFYKSNTYNQLMRVTTPLVSGYISGWINAGNIQNKGVELMLNLTPIQTKHFTWDANVNFSKNVNEVVELSPTLDRYKLSTANLAMGEAWVEKGRPFGEIYVRDFKKNDDGQYLVNDKGVPFPEESPQTYVGNFNYDWAGSFSNSFNYKNWGFYFLIDLNYGGWRVSATESYLMVSGTGKNSLYGRENGILFDGVTESGLKNDKRITAQAYGSLVGGRSTTAIGKLFAHRATNSRLREVSVSYSIPINKTIRRIELSAVGRNLFFLYNGCGWFDPEVTYNTGVNGQGFENSFMPGALNLGVNIKLEF